MAELLEKYQVLIAALTIVGGALAFYLVKPKTLREIADLTANLNAGQQRIIAEIETLKRDLKAQWIKIDKQADEVKGIEQGIVRIETRCEERRKAGVL